MLTLALLAAAAPSALPALVLIASVDVPQDRGAQEVQVVKRSFPPGASSGWHTHPGVEVAYLLRGVMALDRAGHPRRVLRAGDSFAMPRGTAHNGVNLGKVPATLVITYTLDKGAPLRTDAPPPSPCIRANCVYSDPIPFVLRRP